MSDGQDDTKASAAKRPRADTEEREQTRNDKPRSSSREISRDPDFGPRYRVLGPLGKGGMGEVFRAYDTELKGEVALKIVRGDADQDASLARFRREIALARKVTSPNVLRVYDLAEHDGLRFLSMQFVDGDDLAAVIRREGKMPLARALAIFRQVCRGLEAAHAQGVIHRDLKPQNVLVDKEGHVHVADFGLARSIGESGMTASGTQLGSPAYMSPEQVKGDPVDERSDIYSLGIMLFQMITGEAPFQATTPHAVMEMRLHKRPPALREIAADAPQYLEAIVARCLELEPGARYATVNALLADLDAGRAPGSTAAPRRLWIALGAAVTAAAAVAIIAVLAWPSSRPHGAPPAGGQPAPAVATQVAPDHAPASGPITVLVLGIENHTPEPAFTGTLDILVDTALRRSSRLDPMASVMLQAKAAELGPDVPVDDQLGKALAASTHTRVVNVRGAISARGAAFHLTLTATDAVSGAQVYTRSADAAALDQIVPTTARLAAGLREALGDVLDERERERTGLSPVLDADQEYALAATIAHDGNSEGAQSHVETALARDPAFARAHVLAAVIYWNLGRPVDAAAHSKLALKLVDQLGERDRLTFLADYYDITADDHDRAIATYEQLLAIWPTDATAETNLALAFQERGDLKKALEVGLRAAQHHARNVNVRANVIGFEINLGDFEHAVDHARQVLREFARPLATTHEYVALASILNGHRPDAVEAYDRFAQADPSRGAAAQADLAMAEGRLTDAASLLDRGVASDVEHKLLDAADVKYAMLAELRLRRGDKPGAKAAAAQVKTQPSRLLAAARVQLAVGDDRAASAISARFASELAPSIRALGKLIDGEALRVHGKPKDAMLVLQDALHLADSWIGHYLLARAAIDAKNDGVAYGELRTCISRRGEAALGPDDVAGYHYVPPLTYDLARVQDAMGSPEAKASYQAFLAMMHDPSGDPMVDDARARVK